MPSDNDLTIYHNPRCSKSREALQRLESRGESPVIVEYLKEPLNVAQLRDLLACLGVSAHEIVRSGEDAYKALGLSKDSPQDEIIAAIAQHPNLMQRPIVACGSKAVIGRPPENVLVLLKR